MSIEKYQHLAIETRGDGQCESQVELLESCGLIQVLACSRAVDLSTGLS